MKVVKRGKLQWYGHVSRSSSLAKTILQGTVKGGRRQHGRQGKKWEDNIRKWTGLKYLGSVITDEGPKPEILSRIAQTSSIDKAETSLD